MTFTSPSTGHHALLQKKSTWAISATVVVVLGVTAAILFKNDAAKASESPKAQSAAVTLEFAPNDIATVLLQPLVRSIALSGSLAPVTQALVKSTVAGAVRQVMVREGEAVQQGAVIAEIDTTDARSRLAAAQAELAERRTRLTIAQRNRDTNLALLQQNFISQIAYDQLLSTYQGTEAAVQGAEAQVVLARKAIDDAVVRAPISGRIAKRMVNGGERIAPEGPIVSIVDLSRLELEATVPASDTPHISPGQVVHFRVDGFGDRQFEGRLERINPIAEASSRAIKVFVSVRNSDGALRGGMFADGTVTVSQSVATPVIPSSAIFEEAGQNYVFAIEAGKLAKLAVRTGQKDEASGMVEVASGLTAGTPVVRIRMNGLKAGAPAVLRPAPLKS